MSKERKREKKNRDYTFFSLTRGMCRTCRRLVDAKIILRGGQVFQRNLCPEHGASEALIAQDADRYLDLIRRPSILHPPSGQTTPPTRGCPHDCGPCSFHLQTCNLPVFSITNACNLECPICFTYNRRNKLYFMEPEEFEKTLDLVAAACGPVDLINITGGEPTLHPRLPELLRLAQRPGIGRVTVNTNGLRLAEDESLAEALARSGSYVVLSLHTQKPGTSVRLHGVDLTEQKRRALETLKRFSIPTTLLVVLDRGTNEEEIGSLIDVMLQEAFIRSVTVQTMTFTGHGGGCYLPRRHLPADGVMALIAKQMDGRLEPRDFLPLPSAHPLCYAVTYLLTDENGSCVPLPRYLDRATLASCLQQGYLPHPSPALAEAARQAITEAWAKEGAGAESERFLAIARQMIDRLFPAGRPLSIPEQQALAERHIKTIYIHAHMDEDTFDVDRVRRCGDLVPDRGRLIPACAYNLFYRRQDERFWSSDGA